ncbi:helix-turn-helix domain-containing protein [Mycobacterium sp. 141]|uniref:helix-turn-helix domain-containing protein n=1 Tax=Mycobacterium sp. 141 TaxID=1120797 RepID=UPI00037BAFB0|nr:helix-turn-helix domain-containing protein [Mycobacterium sp. 141]
MTPGDEQALQEPEGTKTSASDGLGGRYAWLRWAPATVPAHDNQRDAQGGPAQGFVRNHTEHSEFRTMSTASTATLSPPSTNRRLGTDEVAAVLGYAQTATVLRLIREENLPAVRFNRRYYINEADLHAWMAERGLIAATAALPAETAASDAVTVDPAWVAAQVAKFDADALRRAGELLLALSRDAETATTSGTR